MNRLLALALLAVAVFPAAAASRPLDAAPTTTYSVDASAFLRPSSTDLLVRVSNAAGAVPDRLEKLQVKIWPTGDGDAQTQNLFDLPLSAGVAEVALPRLSLRQRVEVRAHVKDGSQNVVDDETTVQYAHLGAVATDEPHATQAGVGVLRAGGNAFDAAAAVLFVLNVVQPALAGIGGGSDVVVHVASENRTYALGGRERAPANTQPTMYQGQTQARIGFNGYSVGVPGTLAVVDEMLNRWGTKPLAELLEPAIGHAQDGFPVGWFLAREAALGRVAQFQPEARDLFRPGGVPLARGSTFANPDLAETFRLIAREGTDVFYRGEIAQAIVDAQQKVAVAPNTIANGAGRMTLEDLASYGVDVRPASHLEYKGYDVYSSPPPSTGIVMLETLGLLESKFPMLGDSSRGYGFGTAPTLHAMIESMRLAFADRQRWLNDPAVADVPEQQLLSDAYLADRASLMQEFGPNARMSSAPPGNPFAFGVTTALDAPEGDVSGEGHTTHFSVIDKDGNVVSFTSTLRDSFGSGILVEPYGFVLNDSLSLFNVTPGVPNIQTGNLGNDAAPNKRPVGSHTPALVVKNGEPVAATGTYGAESIPALVLNIVLDLLDHGLSAQNAVDASRLWGILPSGSVDWNYAARAGAPTLDQVCPPLPDQNCVGVIMELRAIGHTVGRRPSTGAPTFGSLTTVAVDPDTFGFEVGADSNRQLDATAAVVPRG